MEGKEFFLFAGMFHFSMAQNNENALSFEQRWHAASNIKLMSAFLDFLLGNQAECMQSQMQDRKLNRTQHLINRRCLQEEVSVQSSLYSLNCFREHHAQKTFLHKFGLGKLDGMTIFITDFMQIYKPFCNLWVKSSSAVPRRGEEIIFPNTKNYWEAAAK